ncbi:hypothetical protein C4D60_Mb08t14620 [Musa balbisiana]|uniref:RanBP2-type domain-containing protein n=1 Tax=Musa balbisiana TaxID=52838 RepID=A0A4S8K3X1_MUSBA|nr:hypothetical protein C4D60_Mb08t14620 [Musa balbisiana]
MAWYYYNRSNNGGGGGGAWGRLSKGLLPLLALQAASEFHRIGRKPPVTAGLLLANSLIYLRPAFVDRLLPTLYEVSFNPHLILKHGDLKRFFLSPFYHVGDAHLFYNMTSLLWKGIQLETSMGSPQFASMVAALLGMSQGITLVLARSLLLFFDYEAAYYNQFSVGFSGVLFAMKVVLNAHSDEYAYLHGIVVPARHAAWAELILIQLFVPGVSFLGHLGGILAGLLYLHLRGSYTAVDPLTVFIKKAFDFVSWPVRVIRRFLSFQQPRTSGRGRVGSSQATAVPSGVWRCRTCTYDNSSRVDVCEMCSTARRGSGFTPLRQYNRMGDLSAEEVRRRRLERFGG